MAAASGTATDEVIALATADQTCNATTTAAGNQQERPHSSISAIVPRYVPSTMPCHLHPVFMGLKRARWGKL
eukprot:6212304-Pleurochrysis_carterae.AAC.1